jgi:hypothetical protein
LDAFAAGYVDDVGIGRRYGYIADGAGGLVVKDRRPGAAEVGGLPYAPVVDTYIKGVGLLGNAGTSHGATTPMGPDHTPVQIIKQGRVGSL